MWANVLLPDVLDWGAGLCHNPAGALYNVGSYYKRLLTDELPKSKHELDPASAPKGYRLDKSK